MDDLPSYLLTQTGAHASRIVATGFAAVGARGYHYRLLRSLIDAGPASQATLGRRTSIHLSDMVAALNELEAGGYIERSPDPRDKRRNVIAITANGVQRAAELGHQAERIQDELLAPLTEPERAQLTALLGRLLEHHRQGFPPLPPR